MSVRIAQRPFTVDEYHRMAEVGILSPEDRVELVLGKIMMMSPIGSRHAACIRRLTTMLSTHTGNRAIVSVQNPLRLDNVSEPQPDIALLRPRADFYASGHPTPADTLLIIEVADTSLEYDRNEKLSVYSRSEIVEVWVVDLTANIIHRFSEPRSGAYRHVAQARRGDELTIACLNDVAVAASSILG
jgi:hypothetical protein